MIKRVCSLGKDINYKHIQLTSEHLNIKEILTKRPEERKRQ
jgi:hypothetical protein